MPNQLKKEISQFILNAYQDLAERQKIHIHIHTVKKYLKNDKVSDELKKTLQMLQEMLRKNVDEMSEEALRAEIKELQEKMAVQFSNLKAFAMHRQGKRHVDEIKIILEKLSILDTELLTYCGEGPLTDVESLINSLNQLLISRDVGVFRRLFSNNIIFNFLKTLQELIKQEIPIDEKIKKLEGFRRSNSFSGRISTGSTPPIPIPTTTMQISSALNRSKTDVDVKNDPLITQIVPPFPGTLSAMSFEPGETVSSDDKGNNFEPFPIIKSPSVKELSNFFEEHSTKHEKNPPCFGEIPPDFVKSKLSLFENPSSLLNKIPSEQNIKNPRCMSASEPKPESQSINALRMRTNSSNT